MAAYKYIKENIRKGIKDKLPSWRKEKAVTKLKSPTDR
jgi:hypothetical protein